jgi:hypothetical protein
MSPSPYLDSEQTKRLIVQAVATLDARKFDYDGDGALPIRPDVLDYITRFLCRDALGPLQAGGLPTPTVHLNHDGTVTLAWPVAGQPSTGLWLHVPCRGLVQVCKRAHGAQVEETLRDLDPHHIEIALDPIFEWLSSLYAEAN